jgi:hypothetical protein
VILGRTSTLVSTSLILAACAWWLVPLLVIPAVIVHRLGSNDVNRWFDLWRAARPEIRRRRVWSEANTDPGPAKELRIFDLEEYAVARQLHHVLTAYRPIWAHQNVGTGSPPSPGPIRSSCSTSGLVEAGTHDELLARNDRYARLYGIQATAYTLT